MKIVSSYDRIKSELELRRAVPTYQAFDNWEVVPIIRTAKGNPSKVTSIFDSAQK